MPHLNVRRIVTGHDSEGNAVIREDKTMETKVLGAEAEMVLAWTTAEFPSDNSDEFDGALREVRRVSPGGSVLQFVTMHPHTASKHHRTHSLDYGIVLEGHVTLQLDNGEETVCGPGDVVIQRGTIHTWRNDTDEPTKVAFILLDAKPVEIAGKVLEPEN
ncbi:quercetin dioxygenase-like cupin family protein [Microbacterium ginsengiterrae]|uniref:Quercetin dioxygenase-like cupin family protein n=1 Tax=Microbacterium ginsengiterrae TaxID=546115 RepID=A0A7W9CBK1_9MICO|nr:cupin domain-containing protein [Microbacterium ginsengiterrae]MBB5742582.1 quercetin dioxygenase-like cupin family protein [Microbacterium ginsengiterrae]